MNHFSSHPLISEANKYINNNEDITSIRKRIIEMLDDIDKVLAFWDLPYDFIFSIFAQAKDITLEHAKRIALFSYAKFKAQGIAIVSVLKLKDVSYDEKMKLLAIFRNNCPFMNDLCTENEKITNVKEEQIEQFKDLSNYLIKKINIFEAIEERNLSLTKLIVENGADVNSIKKEQNLTPLMIAAHNGAKDIIDYLLDHGADINYQNSSRETCLFSAIKGQWTSIALHLIEKGANVNQRNINGYTPLSIAVYQGMSETAEELIKKGAYINSQDNNGNTPLIIASMKDKINIVRLLLDHEADKRILNNQRQTAWSMTRNANIKQLVKY